MTTPGLDWKATVRLLPGLTEKLVLPVHRNTLLMRSDGCIWTECQSAWLSQHLSAPSREVLAHMTLHSNRGLYRTARGALLLACSLPVTLQGLEHARRAGVSGSGAADALQLLGTSTCRALQGVETSETVQDS